ncbi:flagellar filament capping protein FliD [Paenibacillus sp. CR_12]|uniref:flagellar filament capping protein FliD n=1 Tax=Paenibacillus sp. CR_12 TaxID=3055793 RepID=UPI0035C16DF6
MTIRISGMSSGMDIDALVSDLMKAERIPLTKKTQKKTTVQYRMDLYRDVNSKLMTLRDNINKMRFSADFSGIKASSSNENAVKVSGSNPGKVTTTIEVSNLAEQAKKQSNGKVTNGSVLDLSKTLAGNAGDFQTSPTLDPDPSSGATSLSMTINGVEVSYSKDDTLQSIINKINQSNAGVALSYDSAGDQFVFVSRDTGKAAKIDAQDTEGNFLAAIKMDTGVVETGKDAKVTINGIVSERSSNSFTQDGVTYTLLQPTASAVTITNNSDTEAIVSKIKEFVGIYNETISLVHKLTDEKLARGYDPLTSEQKKEMSEEDVKNWDIMAKRGLLRNDSLLEPFARTMRSFLSQAIPVNETTKISPMDIGLGTTAYNGNAIDFSSAGGKIVLNEDKLRKAIEANPNQVEAVFTRASSIGAEEGLFQKMYKQLNTTIGDINKKSGRVGGSYTDISTDLGRQSSKIESDIKALEDKLKRKENFYYKQFAAMEKAMANSNSQLNFLMQNMG